MVMKIHFPAIAHAGNSALRQEILIVVVSKMKNVRPSLTESRQYEPKTRFEIERRPVRSPVCWIMYTWLNVYEKERRPLMVRLFSGSQFADGHAEYHQLRLKEQTVDPIKKSHMSNGVWIC